MKEGMNFFRVVADDLDCAPLSEHLLHGYENERDFRCALRDIRDRWNGRVGECIDIRHGFRRLRFHDTPGGKLDETWIPDYLLKPEKTPAYMLEPKHEPDETEIEIDKAFGFD